MLNTSLIYIYNLIIQQPYKIGIIILDLYMKKQTQRD